MNTLSDSLTLTTYHFTLTAGQPLYLPPFKGSALRGGFGHAFKAMVCNHNCDKRCQLGNDCAYGYIFETTPPEDAELLRNFDEIPRPFIIEPPLDYQTEYTPGETLTFQIKLIGHATNFLTYFIMAFRELGRRGLGKSRGRFRLSRVEAANPLNGEQTIVFDQAERNRIQLRSLPVTGAAITSYATTLPTDRLTLDFLSPTRLKSQGRWVWEGPPFAVLVRTLLGRTSSLSYFHCGERLEVDFRELIDRAAGIKIVQSESRWEDWARVSGRQRQQIKMGGLMGQVTYAGELEAYLPLLALGELIHVGKGTVFGNGQYRILDKVTET